MKAWLYKVLNAKAKAWPYYVGQRDKQRQIIRHGIETIRGALRGKDSHQMLGRGGNALHYQDKYRTDYSGYNEAFAEALIRLGIPTIDSRGVPFEKVYKLAVSGPMIAFGDQEPDERGDFLSYRPLREVAQSYKDAGAKVYNI